MASLPNDLNQIIAERRTVKPENYTGDIVDNSIIQQILVNANWAPTHKYTEPWRFIIFSGEGKSRFCKDHAAMYKSETPSDLFKAAKYQKIIQNGAHTSHIIAVIMHRNNMNTIPEIEEIEAVACAVQNMWLTAHVYQLGAYWNTGGMTYHPKMKEYLSVAPPDLVLGFFFIGKINSKKILRGKRTTPIEKKTQWITE